jgi:hypothetical protein
MAHAQKSDFVLRRKAWVHLNRQGRQFSLLLADELCTSACRAFTACASLCSAVMWRLLVTHSFLLFPLHFSTRASPCANAVQLDSILYLFIPMCYKYIIRIEQSNTPLFCLTLTSDYMFRSHDHHQVYTYDIESNKKVVCSTVLFLLRTLLLRNPIRNCVLGFCRGSALKPKAILKVCTNSLILDDVMCTAICPFHKHRV